MEIVTAEADFPQGKALFAEIIIPLALPKNYTWQIPPHFINKVKEGCRVEVTLKHKKYAGIIKKFLHNKPDAFEPKFILNVLDAEPIVFSAPALGMDRLLLYVQRGGSDDRCATLLF